MSKFQTFIFNDYSFNADDMTATFTYSFDDKVHFTETLSWKNLELTDYNEQTFDRALELLHVTLGVSYYKAYVAKEMQINWGELTSDQAAFFDDLYKNGLGEFIYRNSLSFSDIAPFPSGADMHKLPRATKASGGAIVPMSGGKDSLLTAEILKSSEMAFKPLFMTTDGNYPEAIRQFGTPVLVTRQISKQLLEENAEGAYNGHVPFSAILGAILAATAVLGGFTEIVLSHERSADEATLTYDSRDVNHQYSKSSKFESALSGYINNHVSDQLHYFSLLRTLSELQIHELFVNRGLFEKYAGLWTSCNVANYKQGNDTSKLTWCSSCSKCANAFLLFAPFVRKDQLLQMFNGKNLATNKVLESEFQQLIGLNESKPFECVGEVNELREAARMAVNVGEWSELERYALEPKQAASFNSVDISIPEPYRNAIDTFVTEV